MQAPAQAPAQAGPVIVTALCEDGSRDYPFPQRVIDQYPKLLDSETRYLRLDCGAYELLLGQPISLVSNRVLSDRDDRNRLFYVCEALGRKLTDGELQYVCEATGMKDAFRSVRRHLKGFGRRVAEWLGSKKLRNWSYDHDDSLRHMFPAATAQGIDTSRLLHLIDRKDYGGLFKLNLEFPSLAQTFLDGYSRFAGFLGSQ